MVCTRNSRMRHLQMRTSYRPSGNVLLWNRTPCPMCLGAISAALLPVVIKRKDKSMNLTTFSTEQLNLFAHTLEEIYRQLDDISPLHLSQEEQKRREILLAQAFALEELLDLEMARRRLLDLHKSLGVEESTTLAIASHALYELEKQAARGKEKANP